MGGCCLLKKLNDDKKFFILVGCAKRGMAYENFLLPMNIAIMVVVSSLMNEKNCQAFNTELRFFNRRIKEIFSFALKKERLCGWVVGSGASVIMKKRCAAFFEG